MARRVLLVDDDIAEIAVVKRVLRAAGLQAVLATNASDAAEEVARALPELVLVAAACENGEGLAFARRLAAEDGSREVPLLVLGEGAEDVPAPALPLPIDPAALASEIASALERATPPTQDQAAGLRLQTSVAPPAPAAMPPPEAPGQSWGLDGEALELAVQAEALRQRAEDEATRAAALVDIGVLEVGAGVGQARGAAADAAWLEQKAEQVRRDDYFTVLAVRRDATRSEIGQAAERMLAELAAAQPAARLEPERLADIRQVLEDARDVLLDDRLRAAYLGALAK